MRRKHLGCITLKKPQKEEGNFYFQKKRQYFSRKEGLLQASAAA